MYVFSFLCNEGGKASQKNVRIVLQSILFISHKPPLAHFITIFYFILATHSKLNYHGFNQIKVKIAVQTHMRYKYFCDEIRLYCAYKESNDNDWHELNYLF